MFPASCLCVVGVASIGSAGCSLANTVTFTVNGIGYLVLISLYFCGSSFTQAFILFCWYSCVIGIESLVPVSLYFCFIGIILVLVLYMHNHMLAYQGNVNILGLPLRNRSSCSVGTRVSGSFSRQAPPVVSKPNGPTSARSTLSLLSLAPRFRGPTVPPYFLCESVATRHIW